MGRLFIDEQKKPAPVFRAGRGKPYRLINGHINHHQQEECEKYSSFDIQRFALFGNGEKP